MGEVVRLVPALASGDTVAALEYLLAEARAGKLVGLSCVGLYPGREYVLGIVGEAREAPVFTHGLVGLLAYELIRIHRGES